MPQSPLSTFSDASLHVENPIPGHYDASVAMVAKSDNLGSQFVPSLESPMTTVDSQNPTIGPANEDEIESGDPGTDWLGYDLMAFAGISSEVPAMNEGELDMEMEGVQ